MLYWHKTALPKKKFVFAWCDFSGKTDLHQVDRIYYRKTSLVFVAEIALTSTGWEAKPILNRVAVFHSK
jgi:hypothetical protein